MDNHSPSSPTKRACNEDENLPLKRPCVAHSTPSLGPPQSNRSAKSYLTAAFSDKIKRQVKSLYGDRCWVCKAFPAEAAHIINKTDDQFQLLKDLGIVHFSALGHESNAILLCPLCHVQFDRPNPGLVIVPSNLEWFVQWEKKDRERRIAEYRLTGRLPQRISPTAEDYDQYSRTTHEVPTVPAPYTQYIRVDYFPVLGNRQPLTGAIGTASWHGSPTAMIRKALAAAAMPTGLPYHVVSSLDDLKMLWFVRDPAYECGPQDTQQEPEPPGGPGGKMDSHPGENLDGDTAELSTDKPADNGHTSRGNIATNNVNPGQCHALPLSHVYPGFIAPAWRPLVPSPRSSRSDRSEDLQQGHHTLPGNPHGWKWGPMASAQKVMDYYTVQLRPNCD